MFANQMRHSSANHHQGRRLTGLHLQAGYKTAALPVAITQKSLVTGEASI